MFRILFLSTFLVLFSMQISAQSNSLLTEKELEEAEVFTDIEDALKDPGEVYILDLSSQGLTKLPKSIVRFRNVQILILTDNQLTEFPDECSKLKKLQILYVDSNNIQNLYLSTADPRSYMNLESLYVGFNPLKTIPENIKNIDLMMLSLAGCKYLDLNKVFTPLATINSLEHLDLSYLNLDTIPWEVVNLYGLRTLDLSANPNMEWDTSIIYLSQHKSLEELILQHNKFSMISTSFQNFANLQVLDLSYNDKINLRQVFDVSKNVEMLHVMKFAHCELRELPKSILEQKKLWELDLSHNRLKSIPREIGKLEQLEDLDLSYNDLSDLPDEIGDLQSLENLILTNNTISILPLNMENLRDLRYIELSKDYLDKQTKKSLKDLFPNAEVNLVKSNEDN